METEVRDLENCTQFPNAMHDSYYIIYLAIKWFPHVSPFYILLSQKRSYSNKDVLDWSNYCLFLRKQKNRSIDKDATDVSPWGHIYFFKTTSDSQ